MRKINRMTVISRLRRLLPAAGLALLATFSGSLPAQDEQPTNGAGVRESRLGDRGRPGGLGGSSFGQMEPGSRARTSSLRDRRAGQTASRSTRDRATSRRTRGSSAYGTMEGIRPGQPPPQAAAEGAERARAGEERVTITRQAPAGGAVARRGAPAEKLPGLTIPADARSNAIFFEPSSFEGQVGDRFASTLTLYNRETEPVERVELWVRYNPRILEPDWVDTQWLEAQAAEPVQTRVWREEGLVQIVARLGEPMREAIQPLAQIHWRAHEATVQSALDMSAPAEAEVGAYVGERNILDSRLLDGVAAMRMVLRIEPQQVEQYGSRFVADLRASQELTELDPLQRVRLAIIPNHGELAPGEIGTADVVLLNPASAAFDRLRFRIRYQPERISILDADEDNYIRLGVNIFDGDFHDSFPFDRFEANQVVADQGLIDYGVGSLGGPINYPGGTVARIVYRLEQAGPVQFWFELEDPLTRRRATEISAHGVSLLGASDALAAQALHGARIPVTGNALHARR